MSRQRAIATRRHLFSYIDTEKQNELLKIVQSLLVPGKGILGCHNISKYLFQYLPDSKIKNDKSNRNKFRQLLVTTKGLSNYVSGFLMDHEALHQRLDNGRGIIAALRKQNLIPGIVVDKGILKGQFKGYTTDGIVGLIERCKHYKEYGCDFAKWRSVFFVRNESMHSLQDDARLLSRVAAKCQEVGMVPIIEIDIMPLGEHTIETAQNFFEIISSEVVKAFQDYRVFLEGTILRSSFITSGHNSLERLSPREIARSTLEAFSRTIPPAFGGIVLRGGGKSEEEATILLNEVNRQRKRKPWPITYAFGRSMQLSALKTWNGEQRYVMKAQEELLQRAKANSEATLGKYVTGSIIGMASEFTMPLIQDPRLY